MLGCLLAATQVHAHQSGLHDINHTCISCDLEDIAAHGAAPTATFALAVQASDIEVHLYTSCVSATHLSFSSIRAPPLFS
jgi:thiamine monophosphate kinase